MKNEFIKYFENDKFILMEGALGERLKSEFNIYPDTESIALAEYVYDQKANKILLSLFNEYISVAEKYNLPIMITTPTRRANKERVMNSRFNNYNVIKDNAVNLRNLRHQTSAKVFIGGLLGCKGDAYSAKEVLSVNEAYKFHFWQTNQFAESDVDFLYAGIMPALTEAIGMAKAMEETSLPYIISFMINRNGRLLDGTSINDAIDAIDKNTQKSPLCYMTNCVHPEVLYSALSCEINKTDLVRNRFKGIQANASSLTPEELDCSCELKTADSIALADKMMKLYYDYNLKIFGGCCGTNNTHIEEIAKRLNELSKN